MEVFKRLGIGTANWGKEYNGSKVPEKDQREILDLCMCKGIDLIDTATAYENNVLDMASSFFKIVTKVQLDDDVFEMQRRGSCYYAVLAHGWWKTCGNNLLRLRHEGFLERVGISIYTPEKIPVNNINIIQVPYSLFDRRFEPYFPELKRRNIEIHVRSIFLRGKVLEKVKPHEAIAFCLMNPYVDRVIMGVDSVDQFKENLDYFHWLDSLKITDENILDPRRWKNE